MAACSGDDGQGSGDAGADATIGEAGAPDTAPSDTGTVDTGQGDAGPAADAAPTDAGPPNSVVQLVLGSNHTCALLAGGDVWCWGGNALGQQARPADALAYAPSKIPGLGTSVALAAGGHHTCALDSAGVVRCWGSNQIMELGHDNIVDAAAGDAAIDTLCSTIPCNPTPHVVAGLGTVRAITAKLSDNCARLATGEVKCWGDNGTTGFLGHTGGDLSCYIGFVCNYHPSAVSGVGAGPLTLSEKLGCVLSSNAVSCWGNNANSGLAMVQDKNAHTTPVAIGGLPAISALGSGNQTPYAIGPGGSLFGWGQAWAGEVGHGCGTLYATTPQMVLEAGVTDVGGGLQFGCALVASGVTCWGNDLHGVLGRGGDAGATCVTPAPVVGLSNVIRLGLGFGHACVVEADNSVWCWGYNDAGQSGHDPSGDPDCGGFGKCSTTPKKVVGLP
jgi:alpha-tubulin suppressor-like RCC1 family protein